MVGGDALYDIRKDPAEKTNVISQHPEVARKLLKSYHAFWDRARPLLINEDAPLDVEKPFASSYARQKAGEGIPEWIAPSL